MSISFLAVLLLVPAAAISRALSDSGAGGTVRQAVQERLVRCKLEVHPSKTKIVYCQDSNRRASYPETSFEFLSFTFRPRRARDRRGAYFVSFSPAVSRGRRSGSARNCVGRGVPHGAPTRP